MGNAASTVPYGGQISLVNTSLTCTAQDAAAGGSFQTRVGAAISLTAPLSVSFIQKVYLSDVNAQYTIDPSFLEDERVFGSQYRANITQVLDIVNGSPSITIRESEIRSANTNQLSIPANGGILAPQGPITPLASDADVILDVRLQSLKITLEFLDNSNTVKDILTINCGDQGGFEYILASTFVGAKQTGLPGNPSNGAVGQFPYTPVGSKSNIANIPINCTQSEPFLAPSNAFNFTTGGTVPADLHSNAAFNVTNYNNFFTIPGELVGSLDGFYGTDQSYGFTFTTGQDINGRNIATGIGANVFTANPSSVDIARDFQGGNSNPLSDTKYVDGGSKQPITFALPRFGALSKQFTAGACCGSNFGFNVNSIEGALSSTAQNSGATAGAETITCKALFPNRLLSSQVH